MPQDENETTARQVCRPVQGYAGQETDAGGSCSQPQTKDRYRRSRLSALKWGVELHDILMSRGATKCVYAARCWFLETPSNRRKCVAGEECPAERIHYEDMVASARKQFWQAREQLDPNEFESLIRDLAILDLRKIRLYSRRREEGMVRRMRRRTPDGNYSECDELTLSNSRYMKAVDRRFAEVITRLLARATDSPPDSAPSR